MQYARDLIVRQLAKDEELRLIHLQDAILTLFSGEKSTGLLMLRDIVNATCGFLELEKYTQIKDKSLQRMLSLRGNPNTDNMMKIISYLLMQEKADIELKKVV